MINYYYFCQGLAKNGFMVNNQMYFIFLTISLTRIFHREAVKRET